MSNQSKFTESLELRCTSEYRGVRCEQMSARHQQAFGHLRHNAGPFYWTDASKKRDENPPVKPTRPPSTEQKIKMMLWNTRDQTLPKRDITRALKYRKDFHVVYITMLEVGTIYERGSGVKYDETITCLK